MDRYETRLFTPTPDESVDDNHPVRHLDEILRGMDWSDWTAQYNGRVGQPPIPPWVMAGVILYGLMRRIRSSRQSYGPTCFMKRKNAYSDSPRAGRGRRSGCFLATISRIVV